MLMSLAENENEINKIDNVHLRERWSLHRHHFHLKLLIQISFSLFDLFKNHLKCLIKKEKFSFSNKFNFGEHDKEFHLLGPSIE